MLENDKSSNKASVAFQPALPTQLLPSVESSRPPGHRQLKLPGSLIQDPPRHRDWSSAHSSMSAELTRNDKLLYKQKCKIKVRTHTKNPDPYPRCKDKTTIKLTLMFSTRNCTVWPFVIFVFARDQFKMFNILISCTCDFWTLKTFFQKLLVFQSLSSWPICKSKRFMASNITL